MKGQSVVVQFKKGRNGSVLARVGGKVSFPVRGWEPQAEELWVVRVAGENPRGTVYFLEPVRKLDGWKVVSVATTWQRPPKAALPLEDGDRSRSWGTGVWLYAVPPDLRPSSETLAKAGAIAKALTEQDGKEYEVRTYELDDSAYVYSRLGSCACYVTADLDVVWVMRKPLKEVVNA